jgi:hypothetical protein
MKLPRVVLWVFLLQSVWVGMAFAPLQPSRAWAEAGTSALKDLSGRVTLQSKTAILHFGKKGAAFPDYKEAIIRYPVASGLKDTTLLQKVQAAISLKQILGQSLAQMQQEYLDNHWLNEVGYTVNYNQNNILDLTYLISGSAAYPSSYEKHVSVDLKTGQVLRAKDLFKADALGAIARTVDQMMQREIQEKISEFRQQEPDLGSDLFAKHHFQQKHLNDFNIGKQGVTFHYNFEFPHAIKAAEPSGAYLLSYEKLMRYIRQDSVLGFHLGNH